MISLQDGSHQDGSHLGGLHLEKQRVGSCRILAPISKADPSQNAVLFCGTPVITLHYILLENFKAFLLGGSTGGGRGSFQLWRQKGSQQKKKMFL